MTEQEIEQGLIEKLVDLKYSYRSDIRDRYPFNPELYFPKHPKQNSHE